MANQSIGEINRNDLAILRYIRTNTGGKTFDSLLFDGPNSISTALTQFDGNDADLVMKMGKIYGMEKLAIMIRYVIAESRRRAHENVLEILRAEKVISDGVKVEVDPDEAVRLLREWNKKRLERKNLENSQ